MKKIKNKMCSHCARKSAKKNVFFQKIFQKKNTSLINSPPSHHSKIVCVNCMEQCWMVGNVASVESTLFLHIEGAAVPKKKEWESDRPSMNCFAYISKFKLHLRICKMWNTGQKITVKNNNKCCRHNLYFRSAFKCEETL